MITLALMAYLRQQPDTSGMRLGFVRAVRAVATAVADSRNSFLDTSEHIIINVPSFLRVLGADSTRAADWVGIADSLGSKASVRAEICSAGRTHKCPMISALRMTRVANGYELLISVSNEGSNNRSRDVELEYTVVLRRDDSGVHVQSVRLTFIT